MSLFLIFYFIESFLLVYIWCLVFKKYKKNFWGKYILLSTVLFSIWIIVYLLAYTTTYDKDILLYISRLLFSITVPASYFMLLFFHYGNIKNIKNKNKKDIIFIILWLIIILFSIFSPYVIEDMVYDNKLWFYYEKFWKYYFLYMYAYFLILPIFFISAFIKRKLLRNIEKIRFKYMYIWFFLYVFFTIIFLVILPLFDIWILQKEQILFFVPFIILTWYSITRYHFIDIKIWTWKILIFLLSVFLSLFFVNILRVYYINLWLSFIYFWWISKDFWAIDLIVWIFIFMFIYKFLNKSFLWNTSKGIFYKQLSNLKKKIAYITNLEDLNIFLINNFKKLFKIGDVKIIMVDEKNNNFEIFKYFKKNVLNDFFINDIVFIEENKYKFNLEKINFEINEDIFLVLPLFDNNQKFLWVFTLWKKMFHDYYFTEDIISLKDFTNYLEWHLKYIDICKEIFNLSINLDKKVDEKTIEYNNLINRQKEFINIISHEIKGPIASTLFHWESLLLDIKKWNLEKNILVKEIWLLNKELIKAWDLSNNLFNVQSYNFKWIKLYKESVKLWSFLDLSVKMISKNKINTKFIFNIDNKIWYLEIDKIQFSQVIDNLLTNAIKFSDKNNWIVSINCFIMNWKIVIEIEDNWKWFENIDISKIFDKYYTWKIIWVWIWMWLYLCKTIVELHNWTIEALISKKYWWAKFRIIL